MASSTTNAQTLRDTDTHGSVVRAKKLAGFVREVDRGLIIAWSTKQGPDGVVPTRWDAVPDEVVDTHTHER
jgi:hypothetical protein